MDLWIIYVEIERRKELLNDGRVVGYCLLEIFYSFSQE